MDYSDGRAFNVPDDLLALVTREGHDVVMERVRELEEEALLMGAAPVDGPAIEEHDPPEDKAAPEPALALDTCPHCRARLSALDLKFGNCMGCGKPLSAPGQAAANTRYEVRI